MAEGWRLVGRDRELSAIQASLDGPASAGAVVAGPSGVGRTRLAVEVRQRARAAQRACVWAAATRASAAIPFGAIAHLIPGELSGAAARPLDVLRQADTIAVAWERADVTARHGGDRPVIVVDDAHLLDAPSALLLHQLTLREHAAVVATVSDGEPIPDPITALWKDGRAERIDVRPLDLSSLEELLEAVLDGHLDPISLDRFWHTTEGRPLYVREVVTAGLWDGSLARRHDVWRWDGPFRPTGRLVDLVEARLAVVDPDCRSLVELMACGEPLPVWLAERLGGRAGLERAERAGLVATGPPESTGDLSEVVRLAPPIVGEVLRGVIPRARHRDCCEQLADAWLREGLRHPQDQLRVAVWQLDAGTPAHRRGVSFTAAARQALIQTDPYLAERLARAALADEDSPETVTVLAEALEKQGRHAEVVDLLPRPSGAEESTAVTLARASNLYWGTEPTTDWRAELRFSTDDDRSRAEGAATEAWLLLFGSELSECADTVGGVLARRDATDRAVVWAATAGGTALGLMGRSEEALAVLERGQAAAESLGAAHPWGKPQIAWARVMALVTGGRLIEARSVVEAGRRGATHGPPQLAGMWAGLRGLVSKLEGDLATAVLSLREAVTVSDEADVYRFVPLWLAELAGATAAAGDAAAARQALGEARERTTGGANRVFDPWIALDAAWVEAADGRLSLAARMARDAADLAHGLRQLAFEVIAVFDVARLGWPELVTDRLATLALAVDGAAAPLCAQTAQALAGHDAPALLAAALGFERIGARLLAAEAAAAATPALRRDRGDARLAGAVERSRRLRELCPDAATPLLQRAADHVRLTRREREIAGLAATGRTSREIASMLRISTRTVDNHLGRVYSKLGVSGRSGLVGVFGY